MEIPQVLECAVIAVPDPVRGEAAKAIVALRDDHTITERDILAHCRVRLGRVHTPRTIEQWSELPKNAVGKIDKASIRQRFWVDSIRAVN